MQKRYAFCSLCLIPFLTLLMASGFSWTGVNFSVIGSRGGRRWAFLVWGALTGNYFYLHNKRAYGAERLPEPDAGEASFRRSGMFCNGCGDSLSAPAAARTFLPSCGDLLHVDFASGSCPGTVFADTSEKKRRRLRDTVEPSGPFGNRGLHFAVLHRHHIHAAGGLRNSRRLYLSLASPLQISRGCCEICLKNQERSVLQTKIPVLY